MPLPHNTLVIMWPPMQEEWKHEVRLLKASIGSVMGKHQQELPTMLSLLRCPRRRLSSRTL